MSNLQVENWSPTVLMRNLIIRNDNFKAGGVSQDLATFDLFSRAHILIFVKPESQVGDNLGDACKGNRRQFRVEALR